MSEVPRQSIIMPKGFILESFVLNSCIPSKAKLKKNFEPLGDRGRNLRIEAGLRLYAQLLTNAWRKRCKELNELSDTFKILKEACQRAAENLEWRNSCYLEQQFENEDLTCQFHISQRDNSQEEQTIEFLVLEAKDLERKKQELLSKIAENNEKCIACNAETSDLRLKVMHFLDKNQVLELELQTERDKAENLEETQKKTAERILEYKTAVAHREDLLRKEIEKIDYEIQSTKIERKLLKTEIQDLTKLTGELEKSDSSNFKVSTRFEKCLLYQQVAAVKNSLEKTFEHRIFKNGLMALAIVAKALKIISPVFPTHIVGGGSNGFVSTDQIGYIVYL